MGGKVTWTKEFTKQARNLLTAGRRGQYQKVCTASTEAQNDGEITTIRRTLHGESRLPGVEKYDLGDGYRLVVQLIDESSKHRVFHFAGSHDETESWLHSHRDYKYARRESDKVLKMIPVSNTIEEKQALPPPSEEALIHNMDAPVFGSMTEVQWRALCVPNEIAARLSNLTMADTLEGAIEDIYQMEDVLPAEAILALHDLAICAYNNEPASFEQRLSLALHEASAISPQEVSAELQNVPVNEEHVTFSDSDMLSDIETMLQKENYADWMVFLHPSQKQLVTAKFNGPARIRGVSGSGKTSVAVHRARYLAKVHSREDNLLVFMLTYNISLKKLLEQMLDDICGVERAFIHVFTMHEISRQILQHYSPRIWEKFEKLYGEKLEEVVDQGLVVALESACNNESIRRLQDRPDLALPYAFKTFLKDEISYVRSRYRQSERSRYLTEARAGRRIPLVGNQRESVLGLVAVYEQALAAKNVLDFEGYVLAALEVLNANAGTNPLPIRCIVADEVQDFSQNELRLLASLVRSGETDPLFLVGDGAQKVYKKGFVLRECGIDITGRSYILKKNYRNTRQIVDAAYRLIQGYEFDDLDSEFTSNPMVPDYPTREGNRPIVVKFEDSEKEVAWVAGDIKRLIDAGVKPPGKFIVIAGRPRIRDAVKGQLLNLGLESCDLREDVALDSTKVKVSTVEGAKGHESPCIYICGVIEGIFPPRSELGTNEEKLHASRLYVAMTRATERLVMTWSVRDGNQMNRPSPFLSRMQSCFEEYRFRDGEIVKLVAYEE